MVGKKLPTDPVINLIANLAHFMYAPDDKDPNKAKEYLRQLWNTITINGENKYLYSLAKECIDRCSDGGIAIHYPRNYPVVLNCFIKRAHSSEWAEQAYKFALMYMENTKLHKNFRMPTSQEPFRYEDGLVLYLTHFVLGLDLDRFFLDLRTTKKEEEMDKYLPHVEGIAKRTLDDLVFWQTDSKNAMIDELLKPSKEEIVSYLNTNILLAAENAKRFGSVNITDEELRLLKIALGIFDKLTLNDATIVPIADYCPKNIGIRKDYPENIEKRRDVVNPTVDDIIEEISTRSKVDPEKIALKLYHWDPAAKWGHFLEDFFAFFNSYEFSLFDNKKGITSLGERYKSFLNLRHQNDKEFREWVDSLKSGWWGGWVDKLVDKLVVDRYLMQFYRATRKSDISLTRYPWRNEKFGRQRKRLPAICQGSDKETLYYRTKDLLSKQIAFYSKSAVESIKYLLNQNVEMTGQKLSDYQKKIKEDSTKIKYFIRAYERDLDLHEKMVVDILYLLNIANKLMNRKIDYGALMDVNDRSKFSKLTFSG